jgi:transposase
MRFRARNLTGLDVRSFLRHLLQHLRGPVALLWDRGPIHRRREVQVFLRDRPRVQWDYFPAYAPELNPAEYVWTQTDAALSNSAPQDLVDLKARLRSSIRRTRSSQQLLWACIYASDLPWPR